MRRLGNVALACVLLAVTFPLLLIIAVAIKLEGLGPVLERRECIGCGGRRFRMLRFRTAIHDPTHATPVWARQMTKVGQFLRYTRIKDLPQLINVLCGEMSMIDRDGHSPFFFD
jgi:lipopolysaccharide/colanic/teichoic acid biosynthesis glycosyltransferase